jgi:hypothetical protein
MDIINIGNSNLGSICYEKKDTKIRDVTNLLLSTESKEETIWNSDSSCELIVELKLSSKITKIILFSQQNAPQDILVEFSKDDEVYFPICLAKSMKNVFRIN